MKTNALALIPAALLLTGCGSKKESPAPVLVQLQRVEAASGTASSYYSGTIAARNAVQLSFQTAGTVTSVLVREGQSVEKGQLLATLDCQNNESALRMAEAKANQARDAFRRFEPMYKNGNLAEIKMVEIETARTQAEQALKLAQKGVADCSITAADSGQISRRDIEPGGTAIPGRPVLELSLLDQVYAEVAVPEAEIARLKPGMRAEVAVAALQNTRESTLSAYNEEAALAAPKPQPRSGAYRGLVSECGVSADPLARTYKVRVLLNNAGRRLLPGMLCDVNIAGLRGGALLLVPPTAVTSDPGGGEYVYVADGPSGAVKRRAVTTAGFAQGGILVSRGLAQGEQVVTYGVQKLSDGTRIATEPI